MTGKKAVVLMENFFEDYELIYPYYRLIEAEAETRLVGPEAGRAYQGKSPMCQDSCRLKLKSRGRP